MKLWNILIVGTTLLLSNCKDSKNSNEENATPIQKSTTLVEGNKTLLASILKWWEREIKLLWSREGTFTVHRGTDTAYTIEARYTKDGELYCFHDKSGGEEGPDGDVDSMRLVSGPSDILFYKNEYADEAKVLQLKKWSADPIIWNVKEITTWNRREVWKKNGEKGLVPVDINSPEGKRISNLMDRTQKKANTEYFELLEYLTSRREAEGEETPYETMEAILKKGKEMPK